MTKAEKTFTFKEYADKDSGVGYDEIISKMKEHAIEFGIWISQNGWDTDYKGNWYPVYGAADDETLLTTEELYKLFNNQPTQQ